MIETKTGWNSKWRSSKLCFDVKKLDQRSVHLYTDDTEITCKSSANDLVIFTIKKLTWDSHINQWLMKAQKAFLLEVKRSLFYKYNSQSKFCKKFTFYQFSFTR